MNTVLLLRILSIKKYFFMIIMTTVGVDDILVVYPKGGISEMPSLLLLEFLEGVRTAWRNLLCGRCHPYRVNGRPFVHWSKGHDVCC
jgi:hypothetical protein